MTIIKNKSRRNRSKFIGHNDTFMAPRCVDCIHWEGQRKCTAFDEIPKNIFEEYDDHFEVIEGQKEPVVFEKIH